MKLALAIVAATTFSTGCRGLWSDTRRVPAVMTSYIAIFPRDLLYTVLQTECLLGNQACACVQSISDAFIESCNQILQHLSLTSWLAVHHL